MTGSSPPPANFFDLLAHLAPGLPSPHVFVSAHVDKVYIRSRILLWDGSVNHHEDQCVSDVIQIGHDARARICGVIGWTPVYPTLED